MTPRRFLVTGGAGYLGAHVALDLLVAGHDVVVVDDFSTGSMQACRRVEELAGRPFTVVRADIADAERLGPALRGVDAVLHFAASKLVPESMEAPERYFQNNVGGMTALLASMQAAGVRRIVYSSSAAVYGLQPMGPIPETAPLAPTSPYGLKKLHGEQMLGWMAERRGWSAVSLRYFNPVGAHASGRIGQPPSDAASLVPRVLQAVANPPARIEVFGSDYPTEDGTCLRDYIHVSDLSRAHVVALGALETAGHQVYNVGTGRAHSVREVLRSCERVTGRAVPHVDAPRRPGDIPVAVADPSRFRDALGFEASRGLDDMVASAWRWTSEHPGGYA